MWSVCRDQEKKGGPLEGGGRALMNTVEWVTAQVIGHWKGNTRTEDFEEWVRKMGERGNERGVQPQLNMYENTIKKPVTL